MFIKYTNKNFTKCEKVPAFINTNLTLKMKPLYIFAKNLKLFKRLLNKNKKHEEKFTSRVAILVYYGGLLCTGNHQ